MVIYREHSPDEFKEKIQDPITSFRKNIIINGFLADNPGVPKDKIYVCFDDWFSPEEINIYKYVEIADFSSAGGIPIRSLRAMDGEIKSLETLVDLSINNLDLSSSRFNNLESLKNIHAQRLDLSATKLPDLHSINFNGLNDLQINLTDITDLTVLNDAEDLRTLGIASTNITDFTDIKDLQLESLDLSGRTEVDITMLSPSKINRIIVEPQTKVKMGKGWTRKGHSLISSATPMTQPATNHHSSALSGTLNTLRSGYSSICKMLKLKTPTKITPCMTKASQTALERSLTWLAKVQDADGKFDCQRYGGSDKSSIVTTSLALLAFLNDGNSTRMGKYRRNVQKGVKWLLAQRDESTGLFGNFSADNPYALYALAECWGMSEDPLFEKPVNDILEFIQNKQLPDGGWGKTPDAKESDFSTTVLYAQAILNSRIAGAEIYEDTWNMVETYLKSHIKTISADFAYVPAPKGSGNLFEDDVTCTAMVNFLLLHYHEPRKSAYTKTTADWITSKITGQAPETTSMDLQFKENNINTKSVLDIKKPNYLQFRFLILDSFNYGANRPYFKEARRWTDTLLANLQAIEGFYSGSYSPLLYNKLEFTRRYGRIGTTAEVCLGLSSVYIYNRDIDFSDVPLKKRNTQK